MFCFVLSFQSFEFHSKHKSLLYLHEVSALEGTLASVFLVMMSGLLSASISSPLWTAMSPAQLIALRCNLSALGASCSKCQLLLCDGHAIVSQHCAEVGGTLFIFGSAGTEINWKKKMKYCICVCECVITSPAPTSRCGSGSHGGLFMKRVFKRSEFQCPDL